jgi:2-aminoadipate transaminase
VRLGWAAGPPAIVSELAAAKANTDQCASALGQRMVEEYGRGGHFETSLPRACELYGSHWRALDGALRATMPSGVGWTQPTGGFLTWVTLPEGLDAMGLRSSALEAGVAYVPGAPFYAGSAGANELRLSFSALGEAELAEAGRRLGSVLADAL